MSRQLSRGQLDYDFSQPKTNYFLILRITTIMPADQSYLASKYLVADPKPTKKRKRKDKNPTNGLLITDDDDGAWGNSADRDDEEDGPTMVGGTSAEFRKTKKSNWKSVSTSNIKKDDGDDAAADAILASAAKETADAMDLDDEVPVVDESVVKMSDGTHAGLQSGAAVSAQIEKRKREERKEFERSHKGAKEAETVYRDATGKRIDVSMQRAEARRLALEAEAKEREAKEALKGDVQQEEARKRRERLEGAKTLKFARGADDQEINDEMKETQRWNDPMMQFMSEKQVADKAKKSGNKRKPLYPGASAPNRYGTKPGHRWDGVDRGIGFEGERFRAINRREMNKGLSYEWQMDE